MEMMLSDYRLRQKWFGTHSEYDKIDVSEV